MVRKKKGCVGCNDVVVREVDERVLTCMKGM